LGRVAELEREVARLIPILLAFVNADYGLKGWGDALILSADLLGWFTPTVFHPLFDGERRPGGDVRGSHDELCRGGRGVESVGALSG